MPIIKLERGEPTPSAEEAFFVAQRHTKSGTRPWRDMVVIKDEALEGALEYFHDLRDSEPDEELRLIERIERVIVP